MSTPRVSGRDAGIDLARGLAGLVMIQGHAYDGWVDAEGKASLAYALTRLLGTLPLPAFLILSGAAVAHRVHAAAIRGEDPSALRRRIVWRGLQIVFFGYATSAAYMLLDGGEGLDTLLRADVLHVIGLSIAIVGGLGIGKGRGSSVPDRVSELRLTVVAAVLLLVVTLGCPAISALASGTTGAARYGVGLFAEVEGVTRMPVFPLLAWFSLGALATQAVLEGQRRGVARTRILLMVGAIGLAMAVVGALGTQAWVDGTGGVLSRRHPAVIANIVDFGGRGLMLLSVGASALASLRGWAREIVLRLGQGSLVAYVFHIPFCYGALGAPLHGQVGMITASALVVALMAASIAAIYLRDHLKALIAGNWRGTGGGRQNGSSK